MGKKHNGTELAKSPTSALSTAPAYIADGDMGFENQQQGDIIFPRAVLMQALSPRVTNGEAVCGEVYNSVTNERIAEPDEKRAVVPIMFWHEWIEWALRGEGGGMRERSQDPEGDLARRCKAGEKVTDDNGREVPAITEYMVFLVQPIDIENPLDASQMFCVCLAKTNYKHGRKWLTLARMRGNKPLFAGVYNLYSINEKNTKGQTYKVFNITNAGWAPESVFLAMQEQHTRLKNVVVQVAAPTSDEGDVAGAAAAAAETEM